MSYIAIVTDAEVEALKKRAKQLGYRLVKEYPKDCRCPKCGKKWRKHEWQYDASIKKTKVKVVCVCGLEAKPATTLTEATNNFNNRVELKYNGQTYYPTK